MQAAEWMRDLAEVRRAYYTPCRISYPLPGHLHACVACSHLVVDVYNSIATSCTADGEVTCRRGVTCGLAYGCGGVCV